MTLTTIYIHSQKADYDMNISVIVFLHLVSYKYRRKSTVDNS
jgi:hypothetical protein